MILKVKYPKIGLFLIIATLPKIMLKMVFLDLKIYFEI